MYGQMVNVNKLHYILCVLKLYHKVLIESILNVRENEIMFIKGYIRESGWGSPFSDSWPKYT